LRISSRLRSVSGRDFTPADVVAISFPLLANQITVE